jgi:hypothetical protein
MDNAQKALERDGFEEGLGRRGEHEFASIHSNAVGNDHCLVTKREGEPSGSPSHGQFRSP